MKKRLLKFTPALLDEGFSEAGCACGHTLFLGELFIGYPHESGEYEFVCLTCHFVNVVINA